MSTIAFNLAVFKEANTYYFDDIYFELEKSGNTIPLTPQEKADTLTWALDKWIEGMMKATDGYVLDWDVVMNLFRVATRMETVYMIYNQLKTFQKQMPRLTSTGKIIWATTMCVLL